MKLFKSNPNKKRLHLPKKIWIPSAVVLVIIIILLLILGWMGLIPGLSNIMGTASQRNLKVSYSAVDLTAFLQKAPLQFKNYSLAPIDPIKTSGKQYLTQPVSVQNLALSQDEVTAMLNSYNWSWVPVDNIQVRFTNDTVELSGLLNSDHLDAFESYIANGRPLNSTASDILGWVKHFRNHVPVYMKGKVSVTQDILEFKLEESQLGRFDIPLDPVVNGTSLRQGIFANVKASNLHISTLYITDNTLHFNGTYPSVIYVKS